MAGAELWRPTTRMLGSTASASSSTQDGEIEDQILDAACDRMRWCYVFPSRMDEKELSPAEIEVLAHLAQGLTEAQVAKRLGMSESTLRRILRQARTKLGATGTTNAIYIATRRGLI